MLQTVWQKYTLPHLHETIFRVTAEKKNKCELQYNFLNGIL